VLPRSLIRALLLVSALFLPCGLMAQDPARVQGRLLLVLPFNNQADQPNLDWISEAVPEILNLRLASAGFMPISRDDRLYASIT
jgi:hypothetical protein